MKELGVLEINSKERSVNYNPNHIEDYVIIMDLDGTLIDSDAVNFKLLYGLLQKYHFEDKIKLIMDGLANGVHFDEIMKKIEMPIEIRKKMDNEMAKLLREQKYDLIDGVKDTLPILKNLGFKLAIATDNYYDTTVKFLKLNKINDFFDDDLILASDNFNYQKPHKEVIEEIYRRSNTKNGILIGNSSKEIDFAKNVDLPIILLDNLSILDSNNHVHEYYHKIRQLSNGESYHKIFKSQSWEKIFEIIQSIIDFQIPIINSNNREKIFQ
jgi:phosphoglycolate phosphatase-like HAD superfamily hydrolase